jgi:hypothetical protein
MTVPNETTVKQLRALFEGREAIYVEKGALHVKVSDIHWNLARRWIKANVEEIPTVGFPTRSYGEAASCPRRWTIGAGYLTSFSDHTWDMGYGGWSLFFAPYVEGVVSLAFQFPANLHSAQRYNEILRYLEDHEAYEFTKRLFPDSSTEQKKHWWRIW